MGNSSSNSKERSELVKFDFVKDSILPKFHAKIIVDKNANKFKMHKYNALAM